MTIEHALHRAFTKTLVSRPAGKAYLLNQLADAEDNGEATIFEEALAKVDDPKLAQMITRHRDDEIRHGALFRDLVKETGIDPGPVPEDQQMLKIINDMAGGFFDRKIEDTRGVMEAYLILQAIEERAVNQFTLLLEVFEEIDPAVAGVIREIASDEKRHLRYCEAISRRYAPNEEERLAALAKYRRMEAEAYDRARNATFRYLLDHQLFGTPAQRVMWRALNLASRYVGQVPLTTFAREAGVSASYAT